MWLALWATVASAAPCADLGANVAQAWALFDDAEIEGAKAILVQANGSLACQTVVVPAEDLLGLFRLDGLVSLALDDRKGAVYATIRSVGVDHLTGAPPPKYGPDLADLYTVWASRLGQQPIAIRVQGGGDVYIDGRHVDGSSYIEVAEGEHLVQVMVEGVLRSELIELTDSFVVATGAEGPGPVPLPEAPQEAVVDVPKPVEDPPAKAAKKHPAGLIITGFVLAAAGGGSAAWAFTQERKFQGNPYTDAEYRGCPAGAKCYPEGRTIQIQKDANRINLGYGLGYGLGATGATLVGIGLIGVGSRDLRGVSMTWAF